MAKDKRLLSAENLSKLGGAVNIKSADEMSEFSVMSGESDIGP